MKRLLISTVLMLVLMLMATSALAWPAPSGSSNCAGYTITETAPSSDWNPPGDSEDDADYWTLDGGATERLQGASVTVADTASSSRTFTVRWFNRDNGPDDLLDTKSITIQRPLAPCQVTTTTQPPTTTTAQVTTTTAQVTTTTAEVTTTTEGESTTTTQEITTTTGTPPPTTTPEPTTTLPFDSIPSTTVVETVPTTAPVTVATLPNGDTELPFTGVDTGVYVGAALLLAGGGVLALRHARNIKHA